MTTEQHIEKAEHNELFAGQMNKGLPIGRDWAVTLLFYSAVHFVGAYFARKRAHFHSHRQRDSAIAREAALLAIYPDYRDLEDFSRKARYDRPVGYFTASEVQELTDALQRIKGAILGLL